MQFVVIAHDGPGGLERRMAARPAHLERMEELKGSGKMLMATAILDDGSTMVGSIVIFDVADRSELDRILAEEPYVTEGVWERIEIRGCKVPPIFLSK